VLFLDCLCLLRDVMVGIKDKLKIEILEHNNEVR
jgi:hypothetical protein